MWATLGKKEKKVQKEEEERKKKEEEDKRREEEERKRALQMAQEREREKERQRREEEVRAKEAETRARQERERKEEEKKKKLEMERKRRREEEKRQKDYEEIEIGQLEEVHLGASETDETWKELYDVFPNAFFKSFTKLMSNARTYNTAVITPEIVFVGPQGAGKSSLIEAFLGLPLNYVAWGGATRRPIYFQLIHNEENEVESIVVKREGYFSEAKVTSENLGAEIEKRSKNYSTEPIHVEIQVNNTWNMTLIDTPGMILKEEHKNASEKNRIDDIVSSQLNPSHRFIICTEDAQPWTYCQMYDWVVSFDPNLTRTVFVYTKLYNMLQKLGTSTMVNQYLMGGVNSFRTFFMSLPSTKVRQMYADTSRYREKIWQLNRRDIILLESLSADKRTEELIGVHSFRRHVLNMAWSSYQRNVPAILSNLRHVRDLARIRRDNAERQRDTVDNLRFRELASKYAAEYLQTIEAILIGTAVGAPSLNGQKSEEERNDFGEWKDFRDYQIRIETSWDIPYRDSKLYGGQQFERLLAEFREVVWHTEIEQVTENDIAAASGGKFGDIAWGASSLAAQRAAQAFEPLIEYVVNRSVYIMNKVAELAEKIMRNEYKALRKAMLSHSEPLGVEEVDVEYLEQYTFFTFHVIDEVKKFVISTAKTCHEKCMEEFYDPEVIYWDVTEDPDLVKYLKSGDKKDMSELTNEIFLGIKRRVLKNVMLKLYNFLFVPMITELYADIQEKVTNLTKGEMNTLFDLDNNAEKLGLYIERMEKIINDCAEQEKELLSASESFSHPPLRYQRYQEDFN